jgi:hypothetical protein
METAGSFETMVPCHITIQCHNPEDHDLQHAVALYYKHKKYKLKFNIFQQSITKENVRIMPQVVLPSHKFAWLPCWYHQWYEIKKNKGRVASNGMKVIPSFMNTHQLVKKLLGGTDIMITEAYLS